jgi:outer membrane protein TolC
MLKLLLLALAITAAATTSAAAQSLSLSEALQRADRSAFANRIAAAQTAEQAGSALRPLAGILPTLRVEGGAMRTTDPIGAFGTSLRQRRITQQDFVPDRLNYPDAAANYSAALVIEQPIFNADAHLGRLAAKRAVGASEASADWTKSGTRVEVIKAFYGAVLAREKTAMLEVALQAARAHVDQTEKMQKAGLVTRSDALLAAVKAGETETALIAAQSEATIARQQLALLLGAPGDTTEAIPTTLPDYASVRSLLSSNAVGGSIDARSDLSAANDQASAAGFDLQRARSLYLPRINAFARYDWNSPSSVFSGDKNWTVGVMTSWTPFAGASELAEQRAAHGRATAASVAREAMRARAALEIEAAESQRRVAFARLAIAQRGSAQSVEAHRIVTRKYEGGLSSVTELLDAAAVETQANLGFFEARYSGIVAEAEYRRALGIDPGSVARDLEIEMHGASK